MWQEILEHHSLVEYSLADLPQLSWQDVSLTHDLDFIARLLDHELCVAEIEHCYELKHYPLLAGQWQPLQLMAEDVLTQCRGTLASCLHALKNGSAFFLGGGMHHAMRFAGRGFCLLNDIVISARLLQRDYGVGRILVIDVDAHKGDGTAQITNGDDSIKTLSLHMANGWPLDGSLGEGPWDIPSDYDIGFKPGEETTYLTKLESALGTMADDIDFAIVVLGADAWEHDELPSSNGIKLTCDQMLARDLLIENTLEQRKIPHAYVMGGGYGSRAHEPYVKFIQEFLKAST